MILRFLFITKLELKPVLIVPPSKTGLKASIAITAELGS